jgi:hypothetical protein
LSGFGQEGSRLVNLKIGSRLRSVVCDAEVVVVRPTSADVDLRCGGHPMIGIDDPVPARQAPAPDPSDGTGGAALGKRYVDTAGRFELLCTRAGKGSLSVAGEPLVRKDAKPLPASD